MAQRLVLLACGSFSPPTPMHLRMFEIARDYFESLGSYVVIGGVVSPVHDAYAKKDLVSSSHRCAMLRLTLRTSDWIKLSEWEVNQEGWTRTRYSLQYHQNYINDYLNACNNGTIDERPPTWLPNELINLALNNTGVDETDSVNMNYQINGNVENNNIPGNKVQLKLLCGGDLLESFATPGLWAPEDLETILGDYGLVVITRSGSNPEKFIYDSDILTKFRRNITIITNWIPNEVSSTMVRRLIRRGESVKYLIDDSIIAYIKMHQLFGVSSLNPKYSTTFSLIQPTMTPSLNDIPMKQPFFDYRVQRDNNNIQKPTKTNNISAKILNYLIGVDEADKNDVYTSSPQSGGNHFKEKRSRLTNKISACSDITPKSFCGDYNDRGSIESLEGMHVLPRKSVKVITDVSGVHKIVNNNKKKVCDNNNIDITDDVIVYLNIKDICPTKQKNEKNLSLEVENLNLDRNQYSETADTPKSPLRNYDEIVKFIFSEHGIQVISDKETVV